MNNGYLPVPQGVPGFLGGLLPAPPATQAVQGNQGFEAALAALAESGELSEKAEAARYLLQLQVPVIAAGGGESLPLDGDSALDDAQIEALMALFLGRRSPGDEPVLPFVINPSQVNSLPPELAALVRNALNPAALPPGIVAGRPESLPAASLDGPDANPAALTGLRAEELKLAPPEEGTARQTVLRAEALAALDQAAGGGQAREGTARQAVLRAEALAALDQAAGGGQARERTSEQVAAAAARAAEGQLQTPASAAIQTPVTRPEWGGELSQRVYWLAAGGRTQQAEIKLNPPELGPLGVKVVIHNDEASVFFTAHHALTRDAVEQALPRLRDMLGDIGIKLAEANVSGDDGSARGETGEQTADDRPVPSTVIGGPAMDEPVRESWLPQPSARAIIDTYV